MLWDPEFASARAALALALVLAKRVAGGSLAARLTLIVVMPLPAPRISTFEGSSTPARASEKSTFFQVEIGLAS
jgi:hypothetical protein